MRKEGKIWLAVFVLCSLVISGVYQPSAVSVAAVEKQTLADIDETSDILEDTQETENLVQAQKDSDDNEVLTKLVVNTKKLKKEDKAQEIYQFEDYHVLEFETEEDALAALKKYKKDKSAEVDYAKKVYAFDTGEADYEYKSWGPTAIQSDKFIQKLLKKYGTVEDMPKVTVGVIDTGVDYNNKFLKNRMGDCSFDSIEEDDDPLDEDSHGTHVAGIIADTTTENVVINAYRVLGGDGTGSEEQIVAGIEQAVEDGVDVINMSLGGFGFSAMEKAALDKAIEKDIVVVTAAGNDNTDATMVWPASYSEAITVAALTQGDDENSLPYKGSYSNFGSVIDVAAPGTDIYSTVLNNKYDSMSGTSMASPFVAAAVALLRSYYPDADYREITDTLEHYALDLGDEGYDDYYGYGEIQLANVDEGLYSAKTLTPVLSKESDFYDGSIEVSIECSTKNAQIYYTTDGSIPVGKESATEKLYTRPITIAKSLQLQAIAVSPDLENSSVVTAKYYINEEEIESDFYVTEDGTLADYRGHVPELKIPESINGIKIKTIPDGLFRNRSSISELVIPDTVEKIGSYAFTCISIEKIYLGKNVSEIAKRAMYLGGYNGVALTEIIVDPDNENFVVEDDVLYSKDKTELLYCLPRALGNSFHIPDTVKTVYQGAFADNPQLKRLYVPAGVEKLCDAEMYLEEAGLFDLSVDMKVLVDVYNSYYSSDENGVLYNKDKTILYQYPAQLTDEEFVVPDTVKEISSYAFYNAQVENVILPEGLEYVGNCAFAGSAVTSVTFPDSVSYLGYSVFLDCENLSISFDGDCLPVYAMRLFSEASGENKVTVYRYKEAEGFEQLNSDYYTVCDRTDGTYSTDIVKYKVEAGGTLYLNQREKTVVSYDGEIGNLRLSNDMGGVSVVRIAAGALAGCDTLTGLVIPENITSMGEYAFKGCENLKSLEISGSMETIPYRAFDRTTLLSEIKIADGVKTIADGAFYKRSSEETVSLNLKLPATVTSIGSYAFYQQDAQQKITLESEPVIGHHAFSENAEITYEIPSVKPTEEPTAEPTATAPATQNTKRSVKKGTLIKKKAATYKVVSIGKTRTVSYEKPTNKKAKKQTIPAQISYKGKTYKVVSVKAKAFYKNTKLQKVTIGKNVKKIGKKAFYGCKKLSSIQVKTKLLKRKNVSKSAFKKISPKVKVKLAKGGWFSLK